MKARRQDTRNIYRMVDLRIAPPGWYVHEFAAIASTSTDRVTDLGYTRYPLVGWRVEEFVKMEKWENGRWSPAIAGACSPEAGQRRAVPVYTYSGYLEYATERASHTLRVITGPGQKSPDHRHSWWKLAAQVERHEARADSRDSTPRESYGELVTCAMREYFDDPSRDSYLVPSDAPHESDAE